MKIGGSSIAVVVNNQDICRLILKKPVDGKYELKISFLKNEFDVNAYRLFANRPIHWKVDEPERLDISYHKGENNKPLTIHLKKREPLKGELQYQSLPLTRIQAPNINQLFPIPLMKIEVPTLKEPIKYKTKKYHKLLEINDCNVIEFFMVNVTFDFDKYINKYPDIHFAQFTLSMEIFATNTVISDYQKSGNLLPKGEPAQRVTAFQYLDDVKIIAIHYPDPNLNSRLDRINVTFIENELAEEILLMLKIVFSNEVKSEIPKLVNDYILLGGSNLSDLDLPVAPLLSPSIGTHTIAATVLNRDNLSDAEKEIFYKRALRARIKLRDELKEYEKHFTALKTNLEKKCVEFVQVLEEIQNVILKEYLPKKDKSIIRMKDIELWFLSSLYTHSEDIHIMLARYLGLESCYLYGRRIYKKGLKKANTDSSSERQKLYKEVEYDDDGIEIVPIKQISTEDYIEFHVWLQYGDMFDIDGLHGYLSRYINEDLPKVLITKGEGPQPLGELGGVKQKLINKGFICEDIKLARINKEKFKWNFEKDDGLLDRIFKTVIYSIEKSGNKCL
jgi:hypothetical protein